MTTNQEAPQLVSDLMTSDLIAVQPVDRVGRARDLLISMGIHALPVMEGNDVAGIITSTDLIDDWPDDDPVSSVMTPTPTAIHREASIAEAAEMMIGERVHHLLVSDDREVIGIVSSFDLLRALTA